MTVSTYQIGDFFDEMFAPNGQPRSSGVKFVERMGALSARELQKRQKAADLSLQNMGITFTVYGHEARTEKVWPFDLLPRIGDASEWKMIERGLQQRIRALNLFIDNVYNVGTIFKDRVVPEDVVLSSKTLHEQCEGFHPPQGVW